MTQRFQHNASLLGSGPRVRSLAAGFSLAFTLNPVTAAIAATTSAHASWMYQLNATLPVTSCADDNTAGTLRSVIASATAGDTVDLTQLNCGSITLLSGQIVIPGGDLTLTGPGRDALAIDGNNSDRVFLFTGSGTLTLKQLTLTHGRADSASANPTPYFGASGGCILAHGGGGNLTLVDAAVTECEAIQTDTSGFEVSGGGVAAQDVTLVRSVVSNNVASGVNLDGFGTDASGGGVSALGVLTLTDSVISGNRAVAGGTGSASYASAGGAFASTIVAVNATITDNFAGCDTSVVSCSRVWGGGVSVGGAFATNASISSSVVSNNHIASSDRAFGAGIYTGHYSKAVHRITYSTIDGNGAKSLSKSAFGGGIYTSHTGLTIVGSTVSNNSADRGGGILADYDVLTIDNSTISSNSALSGGGIFLTAANVYGYDGAVGTLPATVRNSTITANVATLSSGAGGVDDEHTLGGPSTFQSTIVAGNTSVNEAGADMAAASATILGANNLIKAAQGVVVPADTISADPVLGPLQDNGGSTFTHALLSGSPAIDAGNNAANESYDQRGVGFPRVAGAGPDIGATEFSFVNDTIFFDGFGG